MITREMLRRAAAESNEAFAASAGAGYDPARAHQFSPEFERRIRKLRFRADHPYLSRVPRRIASVLLAAALAGSLWLCVDVEARAAFFGWVRETVETFFVYRFAGTGSGQEVPGGYQLTWIPEGYEQWDVSDMGGTVSVLYADEAGHLLSFDYAADPDETIWFTDTFHTTQHQVWVHDYPADLLLSYDPEISSAILWTDEYDTAFCIAAFLPEEDLIRLAESVQKIF